MQAYLGPWRELTARCYVPPVGARCLLDLSPNHAPGSVGLFLAEHLPLDYRRIPDPERFAWEALTTDAAPDGIGMPRPLVPTMHGLLELRLGRFIRRERFRWGQHSHTNRLRDQLRGDFRERWEHDQEHARRCLDFDRLKYRLRGDDWRELVPGDLWPHVDGPLPHETTITDNFNRAASSPISASGEGWSWAVVTGDFQTDSNQAYSGNAVSRARAESDLSSADHYSQIKTVAASGDRQGVAARYNSGADTCYGGLAHPSGSFSQIVKVVTGTMTTLLDSLTAMATGSVVKLTVNGTSLELFDDGSSVGSVTDSAITTNTRCGMINHGSSGSRFDDFEAGDLGGGATFVPFPMRGMAGGHLQLNGGMLL